MISISLIKENKNWQIGRQYLPKPDVARLMEIVSQKLKITNKYKANLLLSNNQSITQYNLQFFNKNHPTNVLSFPSTNPAEFVAKKNNKIFFMGDIIMAQETLITEASNQKKTPIDHFTHLLLHGLLHLMHYDHIEEEEAEIMEGLEVEILNIFGIKNPYNCS